MDRVGLSCPGVGPFSILSTIKCTYHRNVTYVFMYVARNFVVCYASFWLVKKGCTWKDMILMVLENDTHIFYACYDVFGVWCAYFLVH